MGEKGEESGRHQGSKVACITMYNIDHEYVTCMYMYTEPCPQALSKREGEPGIFSHVNDTHGIKDTTVYR